MNRSLPDIPTPTSNTVLEPVTQETMYEIPEASAHFGRFAVTRISLNLDALAQFDTPEVLQAVTLLSHARCQVIGWSGTSSSWLGFDADRCLCATIEASTGARACTSVLALNDILERTGARTLGLITPYTADVQDCIINNYRKADIDTRKLQSWGRLFKEVQ